MRMSGECIAATLRAYFLLFTEGTASLHRTARGSVNLPLPLARVHWDRISMWEFGHVMRMQDEGLVSL